MSGGLEVNIESIGTKGVSGEEGVENKVGVHVVLINGAVFDASWAGVGLGGAPSATSYWQGAVGIDQNGATVATVYHIVEIAGTLTWVDTGATVANLYGA